MLLRPATWEDFETLMHWRNDAEAVKWSRTPRRVSEEEHREWLRVSLKDEHLKIFIAEQDGVEVGTGRIRVTGKTGLLSIALGVEHRQQGHAGRLLDLLITVASDLGCEQVMAEVHKDNRASRLLFASRGFECPEENFLPYSMEL